MTRYVMATFEDFKLLAKSRDITDVFLSRQLFEDIVEIEQPQENQLAKPNLIRQKVIKGYIIVTAENMPLKDKDKIEEKVVVKYIQVLPSYPIDSNPETSQKIRTAIDEIEMKLVSDIENIMERKPMFYSGEIEEDTSAIVNAINRNMGALVNTIAVGLRK